MSYFSLQKIDYWQSDHYGFFNEIIDHVCVLIRSSQTLLENGANLPLGKASLSTRSAGKCVKSLVFRVSLAGCKTRVKCVKSLVFRVYLAGCKTRVKCVKSLVFRVSLAGCKTRVKYVRLQVTRVK